LRHRLRITAPFLVAGLVLLAAGCGGSNTAAPTTTAVGTTSPQGTTVSTGSFASAKNCHEFAGINLFVGIYSATYPGYNQLLTSRAYTRQFQALADAAPSDINRDFQTVASAFSSYTQALGALVSSGYKVGSNPNDAQLAALYRAEKVFKTAKFKAAKRHLKDWAEANCN